jgi:hypothetical protein
MRKRPVEEDDNFSACHRRFLAVLSSDKTAQEEIERYFEHLGFEVYADDDPLRWLASVTGAYQMPDLVVLDTSRADWDVSLYLDVIRRKWAAYEPIVIGLACTSGGGSSERLRSKVPLVVKPLAPQQLLLLRQAIRGEEQHDLA